METAVADGDRRWGKLLRFALFPVGVALTAGTLQSFVPWLGILLFAFGFLALVAWLIAGLTYIGRAVMRRRWTQALSLVATIICASPIMALGIYAGDSVHLILLSPYYAFRISQQTTATPQPIKFDWGGYGFVGSASGDRSLIYDPSEDTAKDVGTREPPEFPGVSIRTKHLLGSFYVVEVEMG